MTPPLVFKPPGPVDDVFAETSVPLTDLVVGGMISIKKKKIISRLFTFLTGIIILNNFSK